MLVSIAEQLERWTTEAREQKAFSPSVVGYDDALGIGAQGGVSAAGEAEAEGFDLAGAEALRERLATIRAAGPGAAAELLAAENVEIRAALLRRHRARQRSQGGGWTRRLGWLMAPLIPCVISVLAAHYGNPAAAGAG